MDSYWRYFNINNSYDAQEKVWFICTPSNKNIFYRLISKKIDIPSNLSKKTATNKKLIDDQIVKYW